MVRVANWELANQNINPRKLMELASSIVLGQITANSLYNRIHEGKQGTAKPQKPRAKSKPAKQGNRTKATRQTKGNINTGGYTGIGSNYSNNIKTKGKKGWKGKLIVPYNKKKTAQYKKKLPHSIFQRFFLTPMSNLDSNNILSFPQDMIVSNPSVDEKHMSTMVFSLSACENLLNPSNYRIGKQPAPYSMTEFVGANTVCWDNNSTNTALAPRQIPYQVNKFPTSAYASRWMNPVSHDFEMPSSVITGVNLNLVFRSGGQPFNQRLNVKIVRCNLPVAFNSGEWASTDGVVSTEVIQRELCNRGNFTSRLAFDTIWTKSILLRGVKGGNQKIPTVRLKKFIKTQYLRSTIRRVSTAGDQATIGAQSLPTSYESQQGYYNNLFIVVSSQAIDDQYVATISRDIQAPTGDNQYTREEMGALRSMPPPDLNGNGLTGNKQTCYFRVGGQFSVFRRVKEADTGITGGLNQTAESVQSLQDQINELQAIVGAHQDDDDCTSCSSHHSEEENGEESNGEEEDCGSGHSPGASPPSDNHTHPNSMSSSTHEALCQHSH